jgi:hypothetical protein
LVLEVSREENEENVKEFCSLFCLPNIVKVLKTGKITKKFHNVFHLPSIVKVFKTGECSWCDIRE